MRVIHWYPNFLGGGGVSNAVVALATAQGAAGSDVWIATRADDHPLYGPLPTTGMRVLEWSGRCRVGRGRVRLHLLGREAARAFVAIEPDIVHIHGEFNPDNWWAPRLWGCPLVLSPHGAFHPVVRDRGATRKRLYMSVARRLLYRKVSRFHALSPNERSDIEAVCPAARTYCVPQGPSPGVSAVLTAMNRETNGRREPIELLFVGRLDVRTKGLDILLEAFALATRKRSLSRPAILCLVGPDWRDGRSHLLDLARRLGIESSVTVGNSVGLAEVPALFQSCDIYVQLSRHEGSPLSLNDALVLGKPAIVSDQVGTISYSEIAHLPHVRVVEPTVPDAASAIAESLANVEALTLAARQARAEVQGFLSWDRAARLHLQEYESLIAEALGRAQREDDRGSR